MLLMKKQQDVIIYLFVSITLDIAIGWIDFILLFIVAFHRYWFVTILDKYHHPKSPLKKDTPLKIYFKIFSKIENLRGYIPSTSLEEFRGVTAFLLSYCSCLVMAYDMINTQTIDVYMNLPFDFILLFRISSRGEK